MIFSKPDTNTLRQYELDLIIEECLSKKEIIYEKTFNKNNELKTLSYRFNNKNDITEGNYDFFMLSYNKKGLSIHSEYSIHADNFLSNFKFEESFFNELNEIVLSKFGIELDYDYINKSLYESYSNLLGINSTRIRIYSKDKVFVYLDMENYRFINYINMTKLTYNIDIKY